MPGAHEGPVPLARLDEALLGQAIQRLAEGDGRNADGPRQGRLGRQGAALRIATLLDSRPDVQICQLGSPHPLHPC